jgi:hypothetical protein
MQDHDERRTPLDYAPAATPSERSFWAAMLDIFRIRRNAQDAQVAKAAAENAPIRAAEARRAIAQPGTPPDVVEKFSRVLARIGKAEGFASVAALPVICLACVAILYALGVVL